MYWYFINVQSKYAQQIINFFNSQKNTLAFVPKVERWFGAKSVRDYVVKDLYPDYIFVKSDLDEKEFMDTYKNFFKDIQNVALLVKQGNSYSMQKGIQALYEKLFNQDGIILHSYGNIIQSKLKIDHGPLCGLEDSIIKVNRHRRTATFDFKQNDLSLIVPLEIKTKS